MRVSLHLRRHANTGMCTCVDIRNYTTLNSHFNKPNTLLSADSDYKQSLSLYHLRSHIISKISSPRSTFSIHFPTVHLSYRYISRIKDIIYSVFSPALLDVQLYIGCTYHHQQHYYIQLLALLELQQVPVLSRLNPPVFVHVHPFHYLISPVFSHLINPGLRSIRLRYCFTHSILSIFS